MHFNKFYIINLKRSSTLTRVEKLLAPYVVFFNYKCDHQVLHSYTIIMNNTTDIPDLIHDLRPDQFQ